VGRMVRVHLFIRFYYHLSTFVGGYHRPMTATRKFMDETHSSSSGLFALKLLHD
jgi:hypothetical protein